MRLSIRTMALVVFALTSRAQIAPNTFGVYANLSATQRSLEVPHFVPRFVYVMGVKIGPMSGWEASVRLLDAGWSVIGATLNPPNAISLGSPGNFIVGLGGCYLEGPTYLLVTYQLGWFQVSLPPKDSLMCLGATNPSSFHGLPGYATCQSELIPAELSSALGDLPAGCLVFNPTLIVQGENQSWGAIKARYRD